MPSPTVPRSGEYDFTVGAAGATVSTVTVRADDGVLILPAVSVAVVVKACEPSASFAVAKLHAPFASAVVVPSNVDPSYTLIVLLATAVPLRVRTVALVMPSPSVALSGEYDVTVGVGEILLLAAAGK